MNTGSPKYSKQAARDKMVQWTNKAERCHSDVRKKLMDWGFYRDDREEIIGWLIEQNLVNEQRYAEAFVHDKFEFNKWGASKIQMHLKQKGISERNISDALKTIPAEDNTNMIDDIIRKRLPATKGLQSYQKRIKIARYLLSRGFESDVVWARIESVVK
ncbi:MAG: regulatory protein RecX [Flavobacteriales bacterium]